MRSAIRFLIPVVAVSMVATALDAASSPATQPTSDPSALTRFSDVADGFTFDYPSAWKQSESKLRSFQIKTILLPTAASDNNLMVTVEGGRLTSDDLRGIVDAQVNSLKSHGIQISTNEAVDVDGVQAWRLDFATTGEFQAEDLLVFMIKDGKQYAVNYHAPVEEFKKSRADVDALLKSFKWTAAAK